MDYMKKTTVLLWTVLFPLLLGATSADDFFSLRGVVVDTSGRGIEGVVVTDGVNFCKTARDGGWKLATDTTVSKYVSISIPSTHRLAAEGQAAARFYKPVAHLLAGGDGRFVLERRERIPRGFHMVAISDPQVQTETDLQRWTTETVTDLKATVDSLRRTGEVVGMTLGDLVFDNMNLFAAYRRSLDGLGVPVFQCIGNHDFDRAHAMLQHMPKATARYAESVYGSHFGPTNYSFNIAGVHVVTLNNIDYEGGGKYHENITEATLAWLRKDLSYVEPGTTVLLNMHAAGWNRQENEGNVRNADRLAALLRPYRVHVFCGHTHYFQNVEVSARLYQHNIGAACGAWWAGQVNRCGAPNGYLLVDVRGTDVRWIYKSTGMPLQHQMRLYGPGEFATQSGRVVANIWDWDDRCRAEWWLDGRHMGTMERFVDTDQAYLDQQRGQKKPCLTSHLFRTPPIGGYREVRVVFTDRFGARFTQTLRR